MEIVYKYTKDHINHQCLMQTHGQVNLLAYGRNSYRPNSEMPSLRW